jgi:hypothetical protein
MQTRDLASKVAVFWVEDSAVTVSVVLSFIYPGKAYNNTRTQTWASTKKQVKGLASL